jgi:hypothetical protein
MRYKMVLSAVFFLSSIQGFSQRLLLGECGIVCTYDAAGNRLKRVYFCNNGIDPYPTKTEKPKTAETQEFQLVDALYPNPTTGLFNVTFSKSLNKASVSILDNSGKTLSKFNASGNNVKFDLSPYPAGMYFIKIQEDKRTITKKVIKQ